MTSISTQNAADGNGKDLIAFFSWAARRIRNPQFLPQVAGIVDNDLPGIKRIFLIPDQIHNHFKRGYLARIADQQGEKVKLL